MAYFTVIVCRIIIFVVLLYLCAILKQSYLLIDTADSELLKTVYAVDNKLNLFLLLAYIRFIFFIGDNK